MYMVKSLLACVKFCAIASELVILKKRVSTLIVLPKFEGCKCSLVWFCSKLVATDHAPCERNMRRRQRQDKRATQPAGNFPDTPGSVVKEVGT